MLNKILIQWSSFDVTTSSLVKPLPTPAMFFIALFLPFDFHPLIYPVSFCLNQQLGTAHLVCWLRYAFSQFSTFSPHYSMKKGYLSTFYNFWLCRIYCTNYSFDLRSIHFNTFPLIISLMHFGIALTYNKHIQ